MFDDKHYVPSIRWRQGEREGLKELRPSQRVNLTPLVDIPPIPWNFEDERPSRSIDQHIASVSEQMLDAWGSERPIFVDLGLVDGTIRMASGQHPVEFLFRQFATDGVQAIPVTGTDRDTDYQSAVRTVVANDQRGVCIRTTVDDLADATSIGGLDDLRDEVGVSHSNTDLVLDFRSIEPSQVSLLRTLITATISNLPSINVYRTLTLLTGAFPVNLSGIAPGVALLPRADWTLWLSLRAVTGMRLPSFGDYTATHPDQEEIDPRIIQMSASIRYASETDWVIVKGRSVRNPRYGGYGQYPQLSRTLRAHPLYTGSSFSWASDYIDQCASGGRTGNPMIWRKVATNRHMARVSHQIATLP